MVMISFVSLNVLLAPEIIYRTNDFVRLLRVFPYKPKQYERKGIGVFWL